MDGLSSGSKATRTGLVAATAIALGLDLIAVMRYPPAGSTTLLAAAGGTLLLLALAAWFWWVGVGGDEATACARRIGIRAGLVGGALWVVEIGYNNFVSPRSSTKDLGALVHTRDRVDDIFWSLAAVAILVGVVIAARRVGRWRDGVTAGFWGGIVSGLAACLMALAMVAVWMSFLVHDPINIAEFANRGGDRTTKSMAAYFAYETMAGAFLHLTVLGLVMGGLIGVFGGLIGKLLTRARRPEG